MKTGRHSNVVETETDAEELKPFWKKTFKIGGKEVKFKQEQIEQKME